MQNQSTRASRFRKRAIRTTVFFAFGGAVWVLLSDFFLEFAVRQHTTFLFFEILKGVLFVLATSLLVYWLSYHAYKNIECEVIEHQLDETENLLKTLLSNLGDAILLIDPATRTIMSCNEAVEPVFGYSREELIGQRTANLHVDTESYQHFGNISEPILEKEGVFRTHYRMKKKDDTVIETENTVIALHEVDGWKEGVVSIVRDITDHVRVEEALRISEEKHRLLAENTLDVIWSMNLDLEFIYVNPAIKQLTGHTPEEFIGSTLAEHCSAETLAEFKQIIQREMERGPHEDGTMIQEEFLRKDGSPVPVEIHGVILFAENGEPVGIQGTTRDISERRALEAQVRQSQKMESIGTLASGIAHEINNPIMAITGFAEMIESSSGNVEKNRQHAGKIKAETDRIHTIIRNLLGFARKEVGEPPSLHPLDEIVDTTVSLIQTTIRHNHIALEIDIPYTLPPVYCHKQQIQQVILNLITNACDALDEKFDGYHDDKKIIIKARKINEPEQPAVRLTVEDHGSGIRKELRERMFEPFYTTKPEGKGTGLGLWITYNIVRNLGGEIAVETEEGAFTRFHVELPTENPGR